MIKIMKWKKAFFWLLWFIVILIGAFTKEYIPTDWVYAYGFFMGSTALTLLRLGED